MHHLYREPGISMTGKTTISFLDLPARCTKPRTCGLTGVIDNGLPLGVFIDMVQSTAEYLDFVKFGWGTALVSSAMEKKIEALQAHDIDFWFGGTLFEISYSQEKLDSFVQWSRQLGAKHFEISDGIIELEQDIKCDLISELSEEFMVLSEIGCKDSVRVMSPSEWIDRIGHELEAGAWKIIAEGRECGKAGIYRNTGEVRLGLIQDMVNAGVPFDSMFFEAPLKSQQAWFVRNFGSEVNLANISSGDVIGLETLRLGLRADTAHLSVPGHQPARGDANITAKT